MDWPSVPLLLVCVAFAGVYAYFASPPRRKDGAVTDPQRPREIGVATLPILMRSAVIEELTMRAQTLRLPLSELLTSIADDFYEVDRQEGPPQEVIFGSIYDERSRERPLFLSAGAAQALADDAVSHRQPPNLRFSEMVEQYLELDSRQTESSHS